MMLVALSGEVLTQSQNINSARDFHTFMVSSEIAPIFRDTILEVFSGSSAQKVASEYNNLSVEERTQLLEEVKVELREKINDKFHLKSTNNRRVRISPVVGYCDGGLVATFYHNPRPRKASMFNNDHGEESTEEVQPVPSKVKTEKVDKSKKQSKKK